MISFRFHLLSLVAAFLALAVGIVIGTTLADRAIVDGLRNRVDSVSENLDERQAANERLQAENDRLQGFLTDSGGRLVAGELADQPVVIIAESGVDGGIVDETVALLADAGALVRARVEIQPDWALETPEARSELALSLGMERGDAATMRARLARLLVADLGSPVAVVDDDNGAIDAAAGQGLISYDEVDDVVLEPDQTMGFVLITGTAATVDGAITDLATASAAEGSPTVAAEDFDRPAAEAAGIERGESLAALRSDGDLNAQVATVDDLDLVQGRLTVVLALADAVQGEIGHYGYGPDVDGAAPEAAIS